MKKSKIEQEIVEAADKAGIPVFLKDNLRPLLEGGGIDITGETTWAYQACFICSGDGYFPNDDTGEPNPPVGGIKCANCEGEGYLLRQELPE